MNRTIKEAAVKRFHYDSHNHCGHTPTAYNFARCLKNLHGITPHEFI
jgi:hypothetical protein